jgi:hypothetical protein
MSQFKRIFSPLVVDTAALSQPSSNDKLSDSKMRNNNTTVSWHGDRLGYQLFFVVSAGDSLGTGTG